MRDENGTTGQSVTMPLHDTIPIMSTDVGNLNVYIYFLYINTP